MSRSKDHSAAGRIIVLKNSNYTVWNRTRDLPAFSTVPQPNAPPRAPAYDTQKRFYVKISRKIGNV